MLTIELIGVSAATCGDHSYQHPRKSPIAPLCRRLIDHGHAPETLVSVHRGGTLVFKPRPLAKWIENDIIDTDDRGLVRRRNKPLPETFSAAASGEAQGVRPGRSAGQASGALIAA